MWRKGWESVGGECGEVRWRCGKVCWERSGEWKNMGGVGKCVGMWGSSLNRGVGKCVGMWGEVRKGGGVKKCGRGVGKCFACGGK